MTTVRVSLLIILIAVIAGGPASVEGTRARGTAVVPSLVGTITLGGTSGDVLLGDVDGDGSTDAVTLRGGSIQAVSNDGRTLYDQFLGATDLVTLADLDGNGKSEVLYVDRIGRSLGAVDLTAGTVKWRYLFSESVDIDPSYVRVADINTSIPGLETVVFPDYSRTLTDAAGFFLTAGGELYARPIIKNINGNQLNYPQLAIANIDNSGDPEVVVVGRPKLLVYASNGQLLRELEFRAGDPEGRHYGTLTLANVDGDSDLEAIVIADRISPEPAGKPQAITVFDLSPTIRELWRYVPQTGQTFESISNSVADFDGDGWGDLAVNRFDGATETVEIYRGAGDAAHPGQPKLIASLRDAFAWDAVDLNGDHVPELLTSRTKQAKPSLSYQSQLAVFDVVSGAQGVRFRQRGELLDGVRYVTRPLRFLDRYDESSSLSADRSGVALAAFPGGPAFATYSKTPAGSFRLQFRSVGAAGLKSADIAPRPGTIRAIGPHDIFLVAEGAGDEPADLLAFYRWDAERATLVNAGTRFRSSAFEASTPVLADLNGDGRDEVMAREPAKKIAAFSFDPVTGQSDELWSASGNSAPLAISTLTRQADARVFVVAPDKNDRAMLVAHSGNGAIVWKTRFRELPGSTKPDIVLGSFTKAGSRDIWVSAPRAHSWMVRGTDGAIAWDSATVYNFTNREAVTDYNGDGLDDLVVVSNATYGVYSGKDAKALVGPVDVRTTGGDLFATPLLAGDGSMALAARGTLARAHLDGKPQWSVSRPVQRANYTLAPALGLDTHGGGVRIGGNFGELDRFAAYDYANGRLAFTFDVVPMTDTVVFDTNGDGVDEFIVGTTDGRIVGIDSRTGSEAWSINVRSFTGTPAIARTTDGLLIYVPVADGTLRVYRLDASGRG